MLPKVSIIIPTYNRTKYLKKAIDSALEQDYQNLEILISDNASSNYTIDIIKQYSNNRKIACIFNKKNLGMVKNWRNALYQHVTGEWFLILSDDDYLIDCSYISKAVELIRDYPELVLVYASGYLKVEESGRFYKLSIPFNGVCKGSEILLSRGHVKPQDFMLCNVLFKTSESRSLNCFSNEYSVTCDSELFLRLCLRGSVGVLNDFVSVYRIHDQNLTLKVSKDFKLFSNNWLFITKPYLDIIGLECLSEVDKIQYEESVLIPALRSILLMGLDCYPERYLELENKLSKDIGNKKLIINAKHKLFFGLVFFINKNIKFIYQFIKFFFKIKKNIVMRGLYVKR